MDNYQETFSTWDKVAKLYEDRFMHLDIYNNTYDIFCDSIKSEKAEILDIGCGPGNITRYLLNRRPDFTITGIDVSPNMIELARKNNPEASFQVMDVRQVNEIKTTYDGIVCGFCLPYLSIEDSRKLMSDMYNLLKSNGILYLSFVEGDPGDSGFKTGSTGDRTHFNYFELNNLMNIITETGFEKPDIYRVNYNNATETTEQHTILITKK